MEIKGTKTEENLIEAFCGESKARNKYTFYASKAKEAGFVRLSQIYEETANNEKEHAKIWYKFLRGGDISDTVENLKDCIENEDYENRVMYPEFANVAEEEGFREIAMIFKHVAEIEGEHKKRFQKFLKDIENNEVFEKKKETKWECTKCGFHSNSKCAPKKCPVCSHPQAYFKEEE